MAFSKAFPRTTDKSVYPKWRDIYLTEDEERQVSEQARKENIKIMKSCLDDAREIFRDKDLKPYQTDIVHTAIALFEKRASHEVFWKEEKAKEKFDSQDPESGSL